MLEAVLSRCSAFLFLAATACVTSLPDEPLPDGAVREPFIALTRDFEGFETWESAEIPFEAFPGEPDGPRTVYRNRPPEGSAYPVGSILVKVVRPSDDPATWAIFGMAKRGAGFNAQGAKNWEWFRLGLDEGHVVITWRGESPPIGMGYALVPDGGIAGACNTCHGLLPLHDFVIDEPFTIPSAAP
jgi:hypothetical protein